MRTPKLIAVLGLLCLAPDAIAQKRRVKKSEKTPTIYEIDTLIQPIPRQRELFSYYVDKEQKQADLYDGVEDKQIAYNEDELYTRLATQTLIHDLDQLQIMIENLPYAEEDKFVANNEKIGFYRSLEEIIKKFNADRNIDPVYFRKRVDNFRAFLIARHKKELTQFFEENGNIYTFDNISLLPSGDAELKKKLLFAIGQNEPRLALKRFPEYADELYSGDVIAPAAKIVPNEVYGFASSSNHRFSSAIKRSSDPLVKTIVKIAEQSKKPLYALSFLGDIHEGKKTVAEIDAIVNDQDLFFKNLVRLKLENQQLANTTLTDELQYRVNGRYVRRINELHDSPDPVRFKILEGLTAEELYFIMVYGQDEIYTSSFLGANKRMLERMAPMTGDELLTKVHYDKFRTFIRMSAGYNTLSTFLSSMNDGEKTKLMEDFVGNLEKGKEDELEDAVDVADAYGSLKDSTLIEFMKAEVKEGYERSYKNKSTKGMKVYALLATIFESNNMVNNSEQAEEQSKLLNLPPINNVPFERLIDEKEIVRQRVFFYGDEDGKISYVSFMNNFKDGKWKVETNKYWTTITSTTGKPIVIYANLPLAEPQDETAVKELDKHLTAEGIQPAIIVHRGHSYHLPITLDHLSDRTRVVVLGSCGGYHNLANVLDVSPDAHIISSKQTGAMAVNDPIIRTLNARLLEGNNIDWIQCWDSLGNYFADKSESDKKLFSDYVPPHKNLGAIFIKAYRRLSAQENL